MITFENFKHSYSFDPKYAKSIMVVQTLRGEVQGGSHPRLF